MFAFRRDRLDPLAVVMRAEAIIERRAGDAVAVADLYRVDLGAVERARCPAPTPDDTGAESNACRRAA